MCLKCFICLAAVHASTRTTRLLYGETGVRPLRYFLNAIYYDAAFIKPKVSWYFNDINVSSTKGKSLLLLLLYFTDRWDSSHSTNVCELLVSFFRPRELSSCNSLKAIAKSTRLSRLQRNTTRSSRCQKATS
jgi:hypothetical protein